MRPNFIHLLSSLAFLITGACGTISQPNPEGQEFSSPAEVSPASVLTDNTLFTVYGRAFNRTPILGRLGQYQGFDHMEEDIRPWLEGILKRSGKNGVIPAIHLIYAMATPCKDSPDCLLYIESTVKDLAAKYIEPAAKRGWMVVLDTQIGKSDPVRQVKRMMEKGYLRHENVAVALDPEFHVYPGREKPGTPIGTLEASQINDVQKMLDEYVQTERLRKKKILIVHQFGDPAVDDGVPFMIRNKEKIQTYENVELVFDMDGLGKKPIKVHKYNKITDASLYPFIKFRGIKIFFPNRWEKHGHFDKPPMDLDEIFGLKKVKGGPRMATKPDVIIIA